MLNKICTKCNEMKSLNDFHNCKKSKDGKKWYCKPCQKLITRSIHKEKGIPERKVPIILEDRKECLKCGIIKVFRAFPDDKKGKVGKYCYCKECVTLMGREQRLSDPEYNTKSKIKNDRYKLNNPEKYKLTKIKYSSKRRALLKNNLVGEVTTEFIKSIYATEICYYCKKFTERDSRTMEHKIPITRGGPHCTNNLVMACGSCNGSKLNKTEEEYYEYLKFKEGFKLKNPD